MISAMTNLLANAMHDASCNEDAKFFSCESPFIRIDFARITNQNGRQLIGQGPSKAGKIFDPPPNELRHGLGRFMGCGGKKNGKPMVPCPGPIACSDVTKVNILTPIVSKGQKRIQTCENVKVPLPTEEAYSPDIPLPPANSELPDPPPGRT